MSDVEQAFEATLESVSSERKTDEFGFLSTTPERAISAERPSLAQRSLTEVSKKYDRDGKGYLDETERAVRQMDTQNKGYLEVGQVLRLMDALQDEQKRSNELIDAIRSEHKRAVSLKRIVVVLTCFVVLLAVANIGTSFVAARLVKDVTVNEESHDLVSLDGSRLGTTNKQIELTFDSVEDLTDSRRRHLVSDIEGVACANTPDGYKCILKGVLNWEKSINLYQRFCPLWPNGENTCQGDGVSEIHLNCKGVRTTILGGSHLPPDGPIVGDFGWSFWVFPSEYGWYTVRERLWDRSTQPATFCDLEYELSCYCPTDNTACAVFATYDTTKCPGYEPKICGWGS